MRLYRVIALTTTSRGPGKTNNGCTHWTSEVLYCGYDRLEAARIYHQSKPLDYWQGVGNRCRETISQSKWVEPATSLQESN
jgi:hypothetical protein